MVLQERLEARCSREVALNLDAHCARCVQVSNGAAYALVVDTGARTEIGKINQGVQEAKQETTKTPLAQKLDEFGNQLTYIIGIICLAVWGFSYPEFSNPVHGSFFKGALYYAKVAVALGVRYHVVNQNEFVNAHIALHTLPPSSLLLGTG